MRGLKVLGLINEDDLQRLLYWKAGLLSWRTSRVLPPRYLPGCSSAPTCNLSPKRTTVSIWGGAAVPDEGGAAVAANRGMEGGSIEGHFRAQADFCNVSPVDQDHHQVFESRELYLRLPRYDSTPNHVRATRPRSLESNRHKNIETRSGGGGVLKQHLFGKSWIKRLWRQ